jgi:hypothetical protein
MPLGLLFSWILYFFIFIQYSRTDWRWISVGVMFASTLLLYVPLYHLLRRRRERFSRTGLVWLTLALFTFLGTVAGFGINLAQYRFNLPDYPPEGITLRPNGQSSVLIDGMNVSYSPNVYYSDDMPSYALPGKYTIDGRPMLNWAHPTVPPGTPHSIASVQVLNDESLKIMDTYGSVAHLKVVDGKFVLLPDSHSKGRDWQVRQTETSFAYDVAGISLILASPVFAYLFLTLALVTGFRAQFRPVLKVCAWLQPLFIPFFIYLLIDYYNFHLRFLPFYFASLGGLVLSGLGYFLLFIFLPFIRPASPGAGSGFEVIILSGVPINQTPGSESVS